MSVKFSKISILVQIFVNFRFFRKFQKISVLVKFSKQFDFGPNFSKN